MNDTLYIILAFIAGLLLGTLFFGGLWLTVKKTPAAKMPALLVLGSFIFRFGITLSGFYFISLGNWQRLLVCLSGFITARFVIIRLTKAGTKKVVQLKKGASYETQS